MILSHLKKREIQVVKQTRTKQDKFVVAMNENDKTILQNNGFKLLTNYKNNGVMNWVFLNNPLFLFNLNTRNMQLSFTNKLFF